MSYDDEECVRPPHGWKCSRGNGHPGPCAARPVEDDDLIERCAKAAYETRRSELHFNAGGAWEGLGDRYREVYQAVARAVLAEASVPSPAPITGADVYRAQLDWGRMPYTDQRGWNLDRGGRTAFIAHHLNQRGQAG